MTSAIKWVFGFSFLTVALSLAGCATGGYNLPTGESQYQRRVEAMGALK